MPWHIGIPALIEVDGKRKSRISPRRPKAGPIGRPFAPSAGLHRPA